MALTIGTSLTAPIGSVETITLTPLPPAKTTLAKISNAFYGTDASGAPAPATINPVTGQDVTITVLSGNVHLVLMLISSNPTPETVILGQGGIPFATPQLNPLSAVSTLHIKGI